MLAFTLAISGGLVITGCEKKHADVKKTTENTLKDAGKTLTDTADKAKETVKENVDAAKDKVADAASAASARFVEESQKGMDAAKTQFDALKDKVKAVTDPIKKTTLDGLVKGLEGEFGTLTEKFNALKGAKPADAAGASTEFGAILKKIQDGIAAAMTQLGK